MICGLRESFIREALSPFIVKESASLKEKINKPHF
jgi:hypothetical protein